jgi:hypothetical protein
LNPGSIVIFASFEMLFVGVIWTYTGDPVVEGDVVKNIQEDNLLRVRKQFVPRTTDSEHKLPVYPNMTKDQEVIVMSNPFWS